MNKVLTISAVVHALVPNKNESDVFFDDLGFTPTLVTRLDSGVSFARQSQLDSLAHKLKVYPIDLLLVTGWAWYYTLFDICAMTAAKECLVAKVTDNSIRHDLIGDLIKLEVLPSDWSVEQFWKNGIAQALNH
jgi:hypothetical protein